MLYHHIEHDSPAAVVGHDDEGIMFSPFTGDSFVMAYAFFNPVGTGGLSSSSGSTCPGSGVKLYFPRWCFQGMVIGVVVKPFNPAGIFFQSGSVGKT